MSSLEAGDVLAVGNHFAAEVTKLPVNAVKSSCLGAPEEGGARDQDGGVDPEAKGVHFTKVTHPAACINRGLMTEPGEASPQAGGRCLNTSTGWSSPFPNLSPCE